ncbi:protein kinase [Endozoicomonas sp. ONNA1]|uniref:protein kinase domain-containing protein n=1 Tax=Endozoicomonas sp. ONNA1 TaxID=2828740 RepID=UPI0021488376|nr:protein kinase [Endozoicomonas sp. ONNA1]
MDVQSATYPGNRLLTDQGRSRNPCDIVASAAYYVLGKLRLINVPEERVYSKVLRENKSFSATCEHWESPVGKSIYVRKCAVRKECERYLKVEKWLLRASQGPNIVRFIDTKDNTLLMPYAGKSLQEILCTHPAGLSLPTVETYARQLMKGVAHLHDAGIWHLDLKLGNLVVDDRDNLSIIDFGLSQYAGPAENYKACTQGYRPPELFYDEPTAISGKTDVFSAGVIFFEMLARKRLFSSRFDLNKMNDQDAYNEHLSKRLKEVEAIDKRYAELIRSMLAWNPKNRPHADEVLGYFMRS